MSQEISPRHESTHHNFDDAQFLEMLQYIMHLVQEIENERRGRWLLLFDVKLDESAANFRDELSEIHDCILARIMRANTIQSCMSIKLTLPVPVIADRIFPLVVEERSAVVESFRGLNQRLQSHIIDPLDRIFEKLCSGDRRGPVNYSAYDVELDEVAKVAFEVFERPNLENEARDADIEARTRPRKTKDLRLKRKNHVHWHPKFRR